MSPRSFPIPNDDRQRVHVLRSYQLDGPIPEAEFDHIVQQAVDMFQVPTALISFVGEDEQFCKARVGFAARVTSRDASFCTHALLSDDVLVVPDARAYGRFVDNPLVTGDPFIRFYAGAPIVVPGGHRLGSICIIDTEPRGPLTGRETRMLQGLARIVVDQLERRRFSLENHGARRMAAATPDAIVCSDDRGTITFWNDAAERIFGFSRGEAVGAPVANLVPDEHRANHHVWMRPLLAGDEGSASSRTIEVRAQRRDGSQFPVEVSVATWEHGGRYSVGLIMRDLSERDRARERVTYLTYFDRLTDLPNRVAFLERVDQALRTTGRFIAFDDYGTGYASLSLLKRYPLTRLKIDREFVCDLETDPDDAATVRAVIALSASLGLDVIAEGIETDVQAAALASYGCSQAQGYRFGKPMPAQDFVRLFAADERGVAA